MTHTETIEQRPDVDIVGDIEHLIAHYPPLQHDRGYFTVSVTAGVVTVSGHVQSPITRRYMMDALPEVPGVVAVQAESLHDDQSIRLEAGRIVPSNVQVARVQFGIVVLGGSLPADATAEAVVADVQQVAGVRQVVTTFA
ncbi:MAG: BON domain-containing protein [Anaerolineae bacterium]|nr:BON domain-containing protein [Anaerolineae bacterium]